MKKLSGWRKKESWAKFWLSSLKSIVLLAQAFLKALSIFGVNETTFSRCGCTLSQHCCFGAKLQSFVCLKKIKGIIPWNVLNFENSYLNLHQCEFALIYLANQVHNRSLWIPSIHITKQATAIATKHLTPFLKARTVRARIIVFGELWVLSVHKMEALRAHSPFIKIRRAW